MDDILSEAAGLGLRWGRADGVLVSREAVVAEARTWVGTPFMHQHEMKGVSVDCGGVIRGVSVALGLIPSNYRDFMPSHVRAYSRSPEGDLGQRLCAHYWHEIAFDDAQPADVVIVRFDSTAQHGGILVPYRLGGLGIVHASMRGVIETRLPFRANQRAMKLVAAYQLPGVG